MRTVEEVYGTAFADEEAFEAALDQSLAPRELNPRIYILSR
jgi:hypothetical protein